MLSFLVTQVIATLVELAQLSRQSERDKDLEILLLRRQLAIYEPKQPQPMRLARSKKVTLVVLATELKTETRRTLRDTGEAIRIVKPKTVSGWHRELVRWNGPTGSGTVVDGHAPMGNRTAGGMFGSGEWLGQ